MAKTSGEFEPSAGSTEGWLLNKVRWQIAEHFRQRATVAEYPHSAHRADENDRAATAEGSSRFGRTR